MTPLQFEQVFKLLDKDESGYMDPIEMLDLVQAYETWLYEKEFQSAMEAIYSDKMPDDKFLDVEAEKAFAKAAKKAAKKAEAKVGDDS